MTNDEIARNIALLPGWFIEENIQSWKGTIRTFAGLASIHENLMASAPIIPPNSAPIISPNIWASSLNLAQRIFELEQAKLFRVGSSLTALMISTKEKHGLEIGDPYIFCQKDKDAVEIGYCSATATEAEVFCCKNNEFIIVLLPLLDRLWNETRGKINAN